MCYKEKETIKVIIVKPGSSPGDKPGMGDGAIGIIFRRSGDNEIFIKHSGVTHIWAKQGDIIEWEVTEEQKGPEAVIHRN